MENYLVEGLTCRSCGTPRHFSIFDEGIKNKKQAWKLVIAINYDSYCPACTDKIEREEEIHLFGMAEDPKDFRCHYIEHLIEAKLKSFLASREKQLTLVLTPLEWLIPYDSHRKMSDREGGRPILNYALEYYNQFRLERSKMLRAWVKYNKENI